MSEASDLNVVTNDEISLSGNRRRNRHFHSLTHSLSLSPSPPVGRTPRAILNHLIHRYPSLTADNVKSHLQKFRHNRRYSALQEDTSHVRYEPAFLFPPSSRRRSSLIPDDDVTDGRRRRKQKKKKVKEVGSESESD